MSRRIEFAVGLFVTVTALLILASIGYVAYMKGAFSTVYTYTLSSKTGESLTVGMPVVFGGFNIGRVSSTELDDQGTVLVQITIPERHNRMIRADSKFVLEKPLIGSPRLLVWTGDLKGPPLPPKTIPEITVSSDINEIIKRAEPIVAKADQIMANVARVTGNLADPQGDVNRILRDAEAVTSRFAQKESILEMVVSDPKSIQSIHASLAKLKDITAHVDSVLANVDTITGKADQEIYGRDGVLPLVRDILRDVMVKLKKIDVTLDNLNKISGETADAAKDLKVLRSELDATVTAIGNLADELDRKIPFKDKPEIKLP
jgi:phospholipid/cholesterol/gamma-HCH transport system substrate-binding protein